MSRAVCSKCGLTYRWGAHKGSRLKDHPCPCCNAPGRAVQSAGVAEYARRVVKTCPGCGKAGLQYRKALLAGLSPPPKDGHYDYGAMYCPRCRKWVTPVRGAVRVKA